MICSITEIGLHAFEDMNTVTSLSLPEGLKKIEPEAFTGIRITRLDLPSTLTSIGSWAFGGAPLREINWTPTDISEIVDCAFHSSQITDWVVPANVTTLSVNTFGHIGRNRALIQNLYCEEAMISQCEAALQWRKDMGADVKVIPYQANSNGQVFYNNKWYDNAQDILSGNYAKKRIYTVEEAAKVSGQVNNIHLRYK